MKKAKATMDATSVELERRRGTREDPCLQDEEEKPHRMRWPAGCRRKV
jgi:hypothetical protein